MHHKNYFKLDTPKSIDISGDPEGPMVDASIMKILRWDGIDELRNPSGVPVFFAFGFVNSKGEFKSLETKTTVRVIANIEDQLDAGKSTGMGINPVSLQKEKAGRWLDKLITPSEGQTARVVGDFRVADLYNVIAEILDMKGEVVNV